MRRRTARPLGSAQAVPLPPRSLWPKALGLVMLKRSPLDFLERCRLHHGDVFVLGFGTGLARTAWVCDPALAIQVMQAPADQLEAATANSLLQPIVGDRSLLLLAAEEHMERRALMRGEFDPAHRGRYGAMVSEAAAAHLASWQSGTEIDLWAWVHELTMEIMLRVVFGLERSPRATALAAAMSDFVDRTETPGMAFPRLRICRCRASSWGRYIRSRAKAYRLIEEQIETRRGDPGLGSRTDILSDLIQARDRDGGQLSTAAIRDELVTLMIAGKETAAGGLAWTLELLLRHPTELRHVREDLGSDPSRRLSAAVWEALRLREPLFAIGRGAVRDYRLGRFMIPAGMAVAVPLLLVNRSPALFEQPTLYRPERYLQPGSWPPQWIPFGTGIRSCIGARFAPALIALVLKAILERFELELVNPDAEPITLRAGAFVVPKGKVLLRVAAQQAPAAIARSPAAPGSR